MEHRKAGSSAPLHVLAGARAPNRYESMRVGPTFDRPYPRQSRTVARRARRTIGHWTRSLRVTPNAGWVSRLSALKSGGDFPVARDGDEMDAVERAGGSYVVHH